MSPPSRNPDAPPPSPSRPVPPAACTCAGCGQQVSPATPGSATVDGEVYCRHCLYGDVAPVVIYPIGVVRNRLGRAKSDFGLKGKRGVSRVVLHPAQRRFLHAVADERHLTVVFYFHQRRPVRSRFDRGIDGKEVGVFASRTPDRLAGIGITEVELVKVEGTTLHVTGLDAVDGTPVLDLKLGAKALHR